MNLGHPPTTRTPSHPNPANVEERLFWTRLAVARRFFSSRYSLDSWGIACLIALPYVCSHSFDSGINANGKSYGPSSDGTDPDLIAAVGLLDMDGLVKKTDIELFLRPPHLLERRAKPPCVWSHF